MAFRYGSVVFIWEGQTGIADLGGLLNGLMCWLAGLTGERVSYASGRQSPLGMFETLKTAKNLFHGRPQLSQLVVMFTK
jgi:hypothetical protein